MRMRVRTHTAQSTEPQLRHLLISQDMMVQPRSPTHHLPKIGGEMVGGQKQNLVRHPVDADLCVCVDLCVCPVLAIATSRDKQRTQMNARGVMYLHHHCFYQRSYVRSPPKQIFDESWLIVPLPTMQERSVIFVQS